MTMTKAEAMELAISYLRDASTDPEAEEAADVLERDEPLVPPLELGEIVGTTDGDYIACPDPACDGHVVEVDVGMRWNDVWAYYDGRIAASIGDDSDFGRRGDDGFICSSCLRPIRSDALEVAHIEYL